MDKANIAKIVVLLNTALKCEFTTINQYWIYGLTLHHMGLEKLSKKFLEESVEERSHVSRLSSRILQIGGEPKFDDIENIQNITNYKHFNNIKHINNLKNLEQLTKHKHLKQTQL